MRGVTTGDVTTARAWADTVDIKSDEGLQLLTARISARRRGRRWQSFFITVALWAFVIWSVWNRENDVETLQPVIALYALFTPALLAGFLRQVALDRRMAAGLTRRVAGPSHTASPT